MSAHEITTLPFQPTPQALEDFIDDTLADLIYATYQAERQRSPHISLETFAKAFGVKETAQMETRYQYQLLRIFTPRKVNEHVRCDATVDLDHGGGNGFQCGEPSVTCPSCGEPANVCEEHLFEQPCGARVCVECDGKPEFARLGLDAADVAELAGKVGA